jgi:hypothetical protein
MIRGVVEKKGNFYRRFKIKREGRWVDHYVKLPAPTDPGFAEALARIEAKPAPRRTVREGTMAALITERRVILALEELADSTRRNWHYYLGLIEQEHGHRLVADLRKAHVFRIRDSLAATPGKADNYVAKMTALLEFACERDWIPHNPARGIPKLSKGEHAAWPAHVLSEAITAADDMLRLAIVTGLCSSQRLSDVIRMQHGWHDRHMMRVPASVKTKTPANIPMHPMWLEALDRVERRAVTILYDRYGRPFSGTDRIQERLRRLMHSLGHVDAGGQLLYTFHGLGKNACCYLIETGLNEREVGDIVGKTAETVRHYAKQSNVLMVAEGAANKVISGTIKGLVGKI